MFKKYLVSTLIICLLLSIVAMGAPTYVNIGPTTNFEGDVGVPTGKGYYINDILFSTAGLIDISTLSVTDGNFIVGDGTNWIVESGSTARASLGIDLTLYYLKTEIDTLSELETIYTKDIIDSDELAALEFTDLADTPANYTGSANKFLQVNATPDALIFDTISSDDLSDVDSIAMLDENEIVTGAWDMRYGLYLHRAIDSNYPPYVYLNRKRDGDPTNDVASGDYLGDIYFAGWIDAGGMYETGALIRGIVDGTPGIGDMPGRLEFLTSPDASATPALRMAIDNAGNIKLGDGVWTNYVNVSAAGALTFEGTASIDISSDDLSDRATVCMTDENEVVTGFWIFENEVYQEMYSDSWYPYWGFTRARDGDPTYIVQEGDILGHFGFSGARSETPSFSPGAAVRGVAEDTFGSNDTPGRLEFLTTPDGSSTPVLRMAIDNAGNIKMGDGAWTNYVNVTADGAMTAEGSASIEATDLDFTNALSSDHLYSGDKDTQLVGESVVFGDLLYPDWTAGEWLKADADLAAKMPGLRIALESKTDGQTCLMLVKGYIRDDSAFEFTASMVYASVTPGAMSSTAPTESGDQMQRVGVAKSADILFFDPSIDVGEI